MKGTLSFLFETLKVVILALAIVIPIRYFLFQPFFVKGQSMEPNFDDGDYLIVDEISYRLRNPERGEVVVFRYPNSPSQRYIKRIIGLPGETIEIKNGQVKIYNEKGVEVLNEDSYLSGSVLTQGNLKMTLGNDDFFVMGDNRPLSYDSRRWGVVPRENIIGKVLIRAWPFASIAKIETPSYSY